MIMASATQLTLHDSAVLSALFDSEASLDAAARVSTETVSDSEVNNRITKSLQRREKAILTNINTEKPTLSSIHTAIAQLSDLLQQHPKYASAYNNRAQARRMLFQSSDGTSTAANNCLVFADLSHAIELASPKLTGDPVSTEQAQVLASAHTHRALLLYKACQSENSCQLISDIPALQGLNTDALEEMASRDFGVGGRYGNKVAKQMAVHTNPYAKLCGSIVKEALRKEIESYSPNRLAT